MSLFEKITEKVEKITEEAPFVKISEKDAEARATECAYEFAKALNLLNEQVANVENEKAYQITDDFVLNDFVPLFMKTLAHRFVIVRD
jgi:hypothetical protein